VVRCWNRLPQEAVDATSLYVYSQVEQGPGQPDPVLDLVAGTLPVAGDWNWMIVEVSSNSNHSMIL